MKILGIDPGIGRMGWGVIEPNGQSFIVHGYGCVETEPNSDIPGRLYAIYDEVCRIIDEYKPDALSIEDLFFAKNAKTAFSVGQARGVILLAASQKNLQITVYTPLQVKSAVTGYGKADKKQVAQMVKLQLKMHEVPKLDDVSDALAVALTLAVTKKYV
ncbi:MAG TPA: crossover junction endodeoxyribonuclease RuvC [Candidatus Eisenbacteria bacterium]|nr:crossover junction endodeoxyribonuclease RuvC [Candidatus Eisenbacteria bacterium]